MGGGRYTPERRDTGREEKEEEEEEEEGERGVDTEREQATAEAEPVEGAAVVDMLSDLSGVHEADGGGSDNCWRTVATAGTIRRAAQTLQTAKSL